MKKKRRQDPSKVKVKDWGKGQLPREKFLEMGAESLSDKEILAALLVTGTPSSNVFDIAQNLLDTAENDISKLADMPVRKLTKIHGIGPYKATIIKVAMEIARRAQHAPVPENFRVVTSRDAFTVLARDLSHLDHEEFWVLLLTQQSKLIFSRRVGQGGLTSTIADPRVIFRLALDEEASSIIVAHNHPSGNLVPSQADLDLTKRLVEAGKFLGIQVVDHLILAGKNYCSFADSGLL